VLKLEDRFPAETVEALRQKGHMLKPWGIWDWHACALTITYRDPESGLLIAAGTNNLDLLDMMIVRWDEGDTGFDVPYSKAAMLMLIVKDHDVLGKIPLAYFAGLQEEKLKN